MRIGHGYDVHKFTSAKENSFIFIGGVKIQHTAELIAHSDGDVLLHAICDALLGAAALGDIGHHFPDTDDAFKGIDSQELLARVYEAINDKGYRVGNIDCTVVAQAPKMAPHIENMRQSIALILNIAIDQVNVKATTTEKLGFTGRKEGIAAHAVVLINHG